MTAKLTPALAVLVALVAVGAAISFPPASGASSPCAGDSDRTDSDRDRLTDCLERMLTRSSEAVADSDGDGIPDALDMAPSVGRDPNTGQLTVPISVKLYELRDVTKNQAGCDIQDTGHKFWDPYISGGAIRIDTLSQQVPFVRTGLTNDDHPNDREAITTESVAANIALPQNIFAFNRGNLFDVPFMALHLGLMDEDPWNPDDPVVMAGGIDNTNTALVSNLQIHLEPNGDPKVVPIYPISPDEDCAGGLLLRVETPLQKVNVLAAVLGSAQNLVTYDNVNSWMGHSGAASTRSSGVGTGVSAIDANANEGTAIAGNSPGTAVEALAWGLDVPDTDDDESTLAWECHSDRPTKTAACAPSGPTPADCYVDAWATDGCGGSVVTFTDLEGQLAELAQTCLRARTDGVQASSAIDCSAIGETAGAVVAQAEAIVNDLIADCGAGTGTATAASTDLGCGEAIALVLSVPATALALADQTLRDCGIMVSQGARASAAADCGAVLGTILGTPGVVLTTVGAVLEDCGFSAPGTATAASIGCAALLQQVVALPGAVLATVTQLLNDCQHNPSSTCGSTVALVASVPGIALAVVNGLVSQCTGGGLTTAPTASASATDCHALIQTILGVPGTAVAAATALVAQATALVNSEKAWAQQFINGAGDDVDDAVASATALINAEKAWAQQFVGNVGGTVNDAVDSLRDYIAGIKNPCAGSMSAGTAATTRTITVCGHTIGVPSTPPVTIGFTPRKGSLAASASCASLDGFLGTPTDGALTLPEGASYALATLRTESGALLDEVALRLGSDARAMTGATWGLPPLSWCDYQGQATLALQVVTQTENGVATAAAGTFPLTLPEPAPGDVTEYLAVLGDNVPPTLTTTWSDGEGFWATLGTYY